MPGSLYVIKNEQWTHATNSGSSYNDSRESLVRGSYIPGPTTTGPVGVTTFTQVEANSSGYIDLVQSLGTYNSTTDTYDISGMELWGCVRFREPKVRLVNSKLHGPMPDGPAWTPDSSGFGVIKNYGTGHYHGIVENCILDPWSWITERGKTISQTNYMLLPGLLGGDIEFRWCEIRNVTDGINTAQSEDLVSDAGNHGWAGGGIANVPAGQRFLVLDRCWIHKALYTSGDTYAARPDAQSGGTPHNDAFQFSNGRNIWITGCMLGGTRTPADYQTWETEPATFQASSSNDFSNAGCMIQQSTAALPGEAGYMTNIVIEDNFVGGGNATFNVNYRNSNDLSGVTIRRNKILQRGAGWGTVMQDGALTDINGGVGYQLTRGSAPSSLNCVWEDNSVYETGAAVPWATS